MENTQVAANAVTTNGLALTLINAFPMGETIPAAQRALGPMVNVSEVKGRTNTPYLVTVMAYVPANQTLQPIPESNRTGLALNDAETLYLNYEGVTISTYTDRNGNRQITDCRNFIVEYNCDETAEAYQLYYIQFEYALFNSTNLVNSVMVRDQNDDPETDRGTVTMPADDGQ